MIRRARDWLFTVPFVVVFVVVLLVYDLLGRIALLLGRRPFEWTMAALQRTLMATFRICGVSIEVEMAPDIRPNTGYAIVSNHQSLLDIAIIGGRLFTNYPKYVAKQELGRWIPSVSLNLQRGGNALIDRGDRRQSLRAIKEMAREAQDRGVSVVIFPEGTRAVDGELQEFKRAGSAMMLATARGLPIVPTTVDGAWDMLTNNKLPVKFGTKVRVRFDAPIARREDEDIDVLLAQVRETIAGNLSNWRSA